MRASSQVIPAPPPPSPLLSPRPPPRATVRRAPAGGAPTRPQDSGSTPVGPAGPPKGASRPHPRRRCRGQVEGEPSLVRRREPNVEVGRRPPLKRGGWEGGSYGDLSRAGDGASPPVTSPPSPLGQTEAGGTRGRANQTKCPNGRERGSGGGWGVGDWAHPPGGGGPASAAASRRGAVPPSAPPAASPGSPATQIASSRARSIPEQQNTPPLR